jgi:hypothetical protein
MGAPLIIKVCKVVLSAKGTLLGNQRVLYHSSLPFKPSIGNNPFLWPSLWSKHLGSLNILLFCSIQMFRIVTPFNKVHIGMNSLQAQDNFLLNRCYMTSNSLLCPLPDDDIAVTNKGSGFWPLLTEARILCLDSL